MMRKYSLSICLLLAAANFGFAQQAPTAQQATQVPQPAPLPAFDPSTPLQARFTLPPEPVLSRYRNSPKSTPYFYEPTPAEREQLNTILQQLPTFTRRVLTQHVRSISFVEGIPGNGVTSLEEGSKLPVFDIVLRASILHETVSEFLTRKERSYYAATPSDITLNIEGGSLSAVLYVLTHESVHVLDISNRAGRDEPPRLFENSPPDLMVKGVWENARTKVPAYRSPLFQLSWFGSGNRQRLDTAEPTYRALAQTPFVSLYGSSSWYEDASELVTCYYMTRILKQPYRIVLHEGAKTLYASSPMDNPLVQKRYAAILPLFD